MGEMSLTANTLWVEKYRPKTLEQFILPPPFRKKVEQWIKEKDIPHLLLCGNAGTGKTSLAYFLRDQITQNGQSLTINASAENSIDTMRTKIQNFAMGVSFGGQKICITDEADGLSPNAQAAFRNIMETYSAHTRFILTCNYPQKIIEPLKSRCQVHQFVEFSKSQILKTLATITVKEHIKGKAEQLEIIIDSCGTDIRKAINLLQYSSSNGVLNISEELITSSDYKFKILELLNEKKLTAIRELVDANMIKDYTPLYVFLADRKEDLTVCDPDEAHLLIAEYLYRSALVADQWVNFSACMLEIMRAKNTS